MPGIRTQVASFIVGSGLIASGLALPTEGLALVVAGGVVAGVGYALSVMEWKGILPPRIPIGKIKSRRSAQDLPATPTVPMASSNASPVQTGDSNRSFSSIPEMPSLPAEPKKTQPFQIPASITRHKVPLSFIALGTALVVSSIYFLLPASPQFALATGLFIPGALLLVYGIYELAQRPPGIRRFCMHCGYPMMSTQPDCGRCHKQPMSGMDTKACSNCNTVIPALAKYCKDCGAGQPNSSTIGILSQ